jgi:hypothetical protein
MGRLEEFRKGITLIRRDEYRTEVTPVGCVFADHVVDAVKEMYSEIIHKAVHKAVTQSFICTEKLVPSVEEAYLDANRWDSTSS